MTILFAVSAYNRGIVTVLGDSSGMGWRVLTNRMAVANEG